MEKKNSCGKDGMSLSEVYESIDIQYLGYKIQKNTILYGIHLH